MRKPVSNLRDSLLLEHSVCDQVHINILSKECLLAQSYFFTIFQPTILLEPIREHLIPLDQTPSMSLEVHHTFGPSQMQPLSVPQLYEKKPTMKIPQQESL